MSRIIRKCTLIIICLVHSTFFVIHYGIEKDLNQSYKGLLIENEVVTVKTPDLFDWHK